jgi:hypothetical protein
MGPGEFDSAFAKWRARRIRGSTHVGPPSQLTEVPRRDESVSSLVPRSAADQAALVCPLLLDPVLVRTDLRAERVECRESLGDRQPGEFHELHGAISGCQRAGWLVSDASERT